MCGIAGIYNNTNNPNDKENIKNMVSAISHRGPDADGFFESTDGKVHLGQRRLRIIDLNPRADQPMFDLEKTVAIIFNGEIYNHSKLRKNLKNKGYKYFSTSDTESILYGYKEYGTDIFEKLDGDFAVAIWDFKKQKIILARDRIGLKPLYYYYKNKSLYFASEVKSFRNVKIKGFEKEINKKAFQTLLGFQYYFDPKQTMIKGINKVCAGTFIEVTQSELKENRYWTLPNNETVVPYKKAVENVESYLLRAVEKRILNCDVPQGVFLSGGIDSSLIAAMAAKLSGKEKIKTYTAISNSKMDERNYAQIVAKHIGSEHTMVEINHPNILDKIDEVIATYDDLNTVDPGIVAVTILSKKIKEKGITVVLVGEGADEVFGGYSWYGLSKFPFNIMPPFIRYGFYYYILSRCISNTFFIKHWKLLIKGIQKYNGSTFSKIAQFEINDQLPNHFCMKVDKGNMANGIEARAPYLDYKLIEYVQRLDPEYKIYGKYFSYKQSWEKKILRDVAKKYLPKEIFTRKKHGFMLSMIDTMNANEKLVHSRILKKGNILNEYLPKGYLAWCLKPSKNSIIAKEKEFMTWKLFLFSVWHDYFFKNLN